MVIVDTTLWIDYLCGAQNGETDYLDREVGRQRSGLTDLILCKTLQGIAGENSFARVLQGFRRFEIFEMGDAELAIQAARNYRRFHRAGPPSERRPTA